MNILKIVVLLIVMTIVGITCTNYEISGGALEIGNSTNGFILNSDSNTNGTDTMGTDFNNLHE